MLLFHFSILTYVKSLNIKHIYLPAEEHNNFLKLKINDFWLIHCFRLFNRADKLSREWRHIFYNMLELRIVLGVNELFHRNKHNPSSLIER